VTGPFRYQPPKSSIWGHRLGRMPAGRAHALLRRFLEIAAARFADGPAQLVVHGMDPDLDTRLAQALERSAVASGSYPLTPAGVDRCVAAIAGWEEAHPRAKAPVHLTESFTIEAWRIDGRAVPTQSLLTMHYGALPCLSTFLQFDSEAQFEAIRGHFADVGLCKLDPRHLKGSRARRS